MANFTFTPSACFSVKDHRFDFSDKGIKVTLNTTGATVFQKSFEHGLACMCNKGDFCVGSLTDNGTFSRKVDLNQPKAKIWLTTDHGNAFWGSDNYDDQSVYNKYLIDLCPIRLTSTKKVVTIECPCDSDSGPCSNDCYSYGE